MHWYDAFITEQPGVQGGYPIIAGTRTPVRTIVVLYYRTYGQDLARVRAALPHLSVEQVQAALDYYQACPAVVDADIARQEDVLKALSKAS